MGATAESRYELVDPTAVGIVPERLDALRERARREIDEGRLPSCQFAVARHGRLVAFETFGDAAPASRYVVFSMTKGIVAGAIWLLVGDGALSWDTVVAEVIPEFGTNGKEVITLEQLLTHTSGFPRAPLGLDRAADRAWRVEQYGRWRLNWDPGTRFEYHPTSAHWILGELIHRVTGEDERDVVTRRIFEPLGLTAFHLGEPPKRQGDVNDLVSVGSRPTPEEMEAALGFPVDLDALVGEVTEDALLSFNRPDIRALGVPGGGGISHAADVALYYQELLHGERGLWDPKVVAAGVEPIVDLPDPIRGMPSHRSRGLMVAGDPPDAQLRGFGHGLSAGTFGHDGAGGQIAWADPDTGISFCYLTNGLDQHLIREARRTIGLSSRAAALTTPA